MGFFHASPDSASVGSAFDRVLERSAAASASPCHQETLALSRPVQRLQSCGVNAAGARHRARHPVARVRRQRSCRRRRPSRRRRECALRSVLGCARRNRCAGDRMDAERRTSGYGTALEPQQCGHIVHRRDREKARRPAGLPMSKDERCPFTPLSDPCAPAARVAQRHSGTAEVATTAWRLSRDRPAWPAVPASSPRNRPAPGSR